MTVKVNEYIIVNDNYNGIIVLNAYNLSIVKRIELFEDFTVYNVYVDNEKNIVLFYCPENKCIVTIRLNSFSYKILNLKDEFQSIIFSQYYEIYERGFLFTDYNGNIYSLIMDNNIIKIGNMEKDICNIEKIICNQYIILKKGDNLVIEDFEGNIIELFYVEDYDYIDIDYRENKLLLAYENNIFMLENGKKKILKIKVENCIGCKFLDEKDEILIVENKRLENATYLKIENIYNGVR